MILAGLLAALASASAPAAEKSATSEAATATEKRLADTVRYLAGDELGGRGVGTPGINQAADYVARQFKELGLDTQSYNGTPFQKFTITVGADLGKTNVATAIGPKDHKIAWKLGEDFNPLAIGSSGKLDAPLVFVGYGITDKEHDYDDYAGLDVKGKIVIVLRHEPQQNNPHSVFNGTSNSPHAPFSRKLSNAYEHGAAAVVFVTDRYDIDLRIAQRQKRWQQSITDLAEAEAKFQKLEKPDADAIRRQITLVDQLAGVIRDQGEQLKKEFDPLLGFQMAGSSGEGNRIPVMYVRRSVIDAIVRDGLGSDLAKLEHAIDAGPKPHSAELKGWRLQGEITVNRREAEVKNVVAVLAGSGPLADETIVVGAHYDHLGMGGEGSLAPDKKEIHNGADDNASGTAALIEVAREIVARGQKPARRIVFIAFTGEERGLLGSAYYCRHPLFPLEKTVAMLNMDMVGRLNDEQKLIVQGFDTADQFAAAVEAANAKEGFKIAKEAGGFGPSDHSSFYGHKIPVMHFFTGIHKDYHRPSDDFEKINVAGMRRVAELVADVALALADAPTRPTYREVKRPAMGGGGGDRPYFGSIPEFGTEEPGYALSGVTKGGPADKAGLQAGDIIIKLGDSRIGNLEDFDSALRKHKSGEKVPVVVKRSGKEVTLTVTLEPPR